MVIRVTPKNNIIVEWTVF